MEELDFEENAENKQGGSFMETVNSVLDNMVKAGFDSGLHLVRLIGNLFRRGFYNGLRLFTYRFRNGAECSSRFMETVNSVLDNMVKAGFAKGVSAKEEEEKVSPEVEGYLNCCGSSGFLLSPNGSSNFIFGAPPSIFTIL